MAELLLGRRDHRYVRRHLLGREPRERLERHVDAGAVVEAPRGDAVVCELERRADRDDRVARRDEAARLRAVGRTDVDVQLIPFHLLVVLALARDDAVDAAVRRPHLDPLAVGDVRPPAAQPVHREQAVVGNVGDRQADDVEMGEERQQGAVAAAGPPRDQVADGVRLDLGHASDRAADDVEGELLVPGRTMRAEQLVEERRDHGAGV